MGTNNAWNSSNPVEVSKGGTGQSTLTDGAILLGNGTNGIASIGPLAKGSLVAGDGVTDPQALTVGSNDEILIADSAEATGLKWGSVSSLGGIGLVPLNSQTASGDTSIEWDNTYITDTYPAYIIRFYNLTLSGGSGTSIHLSTDNGSTWETASLDYEGRYWSIDDSGSVGVNRNTDEATIANYFNETGSGWIEIIRPTDASVKTVVRATNEKGGSSSSEIMYRSVYYRTTAEDNNAIRISDKSSSYTIATGTFVLYGLREI